MTAELGSCILLCWIWFLHSQHKPTIKHRNREYCRDKKVSLKPFCELINRKRQQLSAMGEVSYLFHVWERWQRLVLQNLWSRECSQILLGHIVFSKRYAARWKQQERPWRNDESQSSRISCIWKKKRKSPKLTYDCSVAFLNVILSAQRQIEYQNASFSTCDAS